MKDSLCAHCAHTEQVAYSGFFCNETGYCENKTVAEGCQAFEPDAIDGMTRMITEKLLAAYPNAVAFTAVKHGRWEYDDVNDLDYCSECNTGMNGEFPYCPWCGAKMDIPEPPEVTQDE